MYFMTDRYLQCEKISGSGSNPFRTRSQGSEICRTANLTNGPVRGKSPNPNLILRFGTVRFGFGPGSEPDHPITTDNEEIELRGRTLLENAGEKD